MTPPSTATWLILAASYLAGALAFSARATPPAPPVPDPLDAPGGSAWPATHGAGLGRDRAWRIAADVLVGAAVAWAALRLAPVATAVPVTWHGYLAGLAAAVGHVVPPWHPRRGGSAAPVLAGALAVLWPWAFPWVLGAGLVALLASGSLAMALVAGVAALPLLAWWTDATVARTTFALAACALVVLRLLPALARIARGDEPRFQRLRLLAWLRRR